MKLVHTYCQQIWEANHHIFLQKKYYYLLLRYMNLPLKRNQFAPRLFVFDNKAVYRSITIVIIKSKLN